MFTIRDWINNDCFNGMEWFTFEDAEEYLCWYFEKTNKDYDEWRGEYYITKE